MRDMEARRQRAAAGKGEGVEHSGEGSKDSKAVPVYYANAEVLQNCQEQTNNKSNGELYNLDDGSGFPVGPSRENSRTHQSWLRCAPGTSLHVDDVLQFNGHRVLDYLELKTQRSFKPQGLASVQLSSRDTCVHGRWLERCPRARYELINGPDSSNNGLVIRRENPLGSYTSKDRMHYSGPLLSAGGSMEDMLKEHEKNIQIAVRKALADKKKAP